MYIYTYTRVGILRIYLYKRIGKLTSLSRIIGFVHTFLMFNNIVTGDYVDLDYY